MATFKNLKGLESYLLTVLSECMNEVGEKVETLMKQHVDIDVYKKGEDLGRNYYYNHSKPPTPTGQLRDSIIHSKAEISGKVVSTEVYNDPELMQNDPSTYLHGSNHWSTSDVRDMLPYLINEGKTGGLFGPVWENLKRPYISNTFEELVDKKLVKQWLKESLEKRLGKGNVK